jgi:hypothetical protein
MIAAENPTGGAPEQPARPAATARARHPFHTIGTIAVEALCPLLLLAILIDATSRVEWVAFERDPSIYASIARYWQDGLIPYRDVWEFKPPMIFVALRTGFALWGYEPESLRRVFLILTWLGACALYLGLRHARFLIAAPVAALGLTTLVVVNPWGLPWQNTETLVVAFGACAMGCAAAHQRDPRWWWALLAGISLGLATLGKQPAALFALPLGMQLSLWGAPTGWRGRAGYVGQRALLGAGGFAIVIAGFALYFASQDALAAFYNAVYVDGANYSGAFTLAWLRPSTLQPTVWQRIPPAVRQFASLRSTWPFVEFGYMWPFFWAIGALVPLTLLRPSRWAATLWAWLFAASMAVLIGPYAENHYLVMTLPALALTTAVVCELCWPGVGPFGRAGTTMRLLGGLVVAAILFGSAWRVSYLPTRSQGPRVDAFEDEARRLGREIGAAAQPGDRLFVGEAPLQIYLYSGVPPASRFIYWNAPNSHAIPEREAALGAEPAFVFLSSDAVRQTQERLAGAPDPMLQRYDLWLTSTVGAVYRRRAPE